MLNFEVCAEIPPGTNVGFSVRSARNRAPFDFAATVNRFLAPGATPAVEAIPVVEGTGLHRGTYGISYGPTPGNVWWEPSYVVTLHDLGTKQADGTTSTPCALLSFDVPFANGNSLYSSPPYMTF